MPLERRIIPRETVTEQFTTFLDVREGSSDNGIIPWQQSPDLQRSMCLLMRSCDAGTSFWLRYFWQEACFSKSNCAKHHLSAGLEEVCYWVAKKIHKLLRPQDVSLLDCFLITRDGALTPQIFSKYDDSRGELKTYLQFQLERYLMKVLRQGQEAASDSDWGLLRRKSPRYLRDALKQADIKELQLSRCMLARTCFKEIYTPTRVRRQLQPPTPKELTAFAELYNHLRSPQEAALSGDDIKTLLMTCIKTLRESTRSPRLISRDAPNYLEEDLEHPNHDDLRPSTPEILLERAERKQQWQQIGVVLAQAIAELPKQGQTMLLLRHGLGLTQTDVGNAMSLPQYQVSRELKKYKRLLLEALAKWSQTQTGNELRPDKINEQQGALDEWLNSHWRSSLFDMYLERTLLEELRDEIPLLKHYYGQGLSQMEVADRLNLSGTGVYQRLEQVKQHLQLRLSNWVEDTYNLSLDTLNLAVKLIAALVEEWLTDAKYSSFEF